MGGVAKTLKKAVSNTIGGALGVFSPASSGGAAPQTTSAADVVAPTEVKNDKDSDTGASDAVKRKRGKASLKIPNTTGTNATGSGTGVNV